MEIEPIIELWEQNHSRSVLCSALYKLGHISTSVEGIQTKNALQNEKKQSSPTSAFVHWNLTNLIHRFIDQEEQIIQIYSSYIASTIFVPLHSTDICVCTVFLAFVKANVCDLNKLNGLLLAAQRRGLVTSGPTLNTKYYLGPLYSRLHLNSFNITNNHTRSKAAA